MYTILSNQCKYLLKSLTQLCHWAWLSCVTELDSAVSLSLTQRCCLAWLSGVAELGSAVLLSLTQRCRWALLVCQITPWVTQRCPWTRRVLCTRENCISTKLFEKMFQLMQKDVSSNWIMKKEIRSLMTADLLNDCTEQYSVVPSCYITLWNNQMFSVKCKTKISYSFYCWYCLDKKGKMSWNCCSLGITLENI